MNILNQYDRIVLGWPKATVAVLLLLFSCAGFWVSDFQLDASADSLVLESDEDLLYSRSISQRYGSEEFVVVTYTPAGDLLGEDSLGELAELKRELLALERVTAITSLLDVPLLRNPPVPLTEVQGNLKTLEDPDVDLELARAELLSSPIYKNLLVSEELRSTAMQVTFRIDEGHAQVAGRRSDLRQRSLKGTLTKAEAAELVTVEASYAQSKDRLRDELHDDIESIRAILEPHRGNAELFLGGVPMIVDDIVSFIRADLSVFGFGLLLLLIATLGVIFRRVRWVALPVLCCASSALVMIGLLGFIGWQVTVVSSNFISLQLIFTMSLTVHLIVRYRELVRENPDENNRELVRGTVGHTFVPCLYASLTTVAGFSSLILCDIVPVVNFGWMMTMGIGVSLLVTFVLFPAVLLLLKKAPAEREKDFGQPLTSFFARLTEHRRGVIFALSALVGTLTLIGASRLEVENSFIDYFKESTEIYRGMEFIDRELGGTTPLNVILDFGSNDEEEAPEVASAESEETDEFDEFDEFAEFDEFDEFGSDEGDLEELERYWFTTTKLDRIAKVHDYLDEMPETGKVSSLALLTKLGREINEGEPLDDFLLAILFQKMPDDFRSALIAPYASVENNQARVNVRIKDSLKTLRRDALLKKIRKDLKEELGLRDDQFRVSGLMVLYNNMLQSLFDSQIKTIGYTVLALSLMFLLLFRSAKIALIAILPSLLSSLVVLGVMGLSNTPLDVMTITIVAISIGIAVDDTIHYLHRFKREFELDGDYVASMQRCHSSIGNAMYYTSITITIGFSILAISNFIPSIIFGLLTALAMMMALVSALSLLPTLILVFKPFGPPASSN